MDAKQAQHLAMNSRPPEASSVPVAPVVWSNGLAGVLGAYYALTKPRVVALIVFTAVVGMLLGTVRFLFPNVLSEPPSKVKVGDPRNFEEGKVTDNFKDRNMWVVRYQGKIYALSTTCTHLGCTVPWRDDEKQFHCPCHNGFFDVATGRPTAGPPPPPSRGR